MPVAPTAPVWIAVPPPRGGGLGAAPGLPTAPDDVPPPPPTGVRKDGIRTISGRRKGRAVGPHASRGRTSASRLRGEGSAHR